jgi:hypothetical protein
MLGKPLAFLPMTFQAHVDKNKMVGKHKVMITQNETRCFCNNGE